MGETLNARVYTPGSWAYVLPGDAAPDVLADRALAAGLVGVWCKASDGTTSVPWWGGYLEVAAAMRARGIRCVPWLVVYPDDGAQTGWSNLLANAAAAANTYAAGDPLLLEPVMTQWSTDAAAHGAASSRALFSALRTCAPGTLAAFCCWGDPSVLPAFPWSVWSGACAGVLPEIYPASYHLAPAAAYNQAFLGGAGGGPGLEQLHPPCPVLPTFDLSAIAACGALARGGGFPAVGWWHLGAMTAAQVGELDALPYARQVQQTAPTSLSSLAQAMRAAHAALGAAEADITAAEADITGANGSVQA